MVKRFFNPLIARFAAVAALLVLALAAPAVFAQEHEPCTMDENTVSCDYDENSMDPVADFSAMDPEGEGIDWAVEGADAADFAIDGGVLTFKKAPNYEIPSDRLHDLNDDTDGDDEGESPEGNNVYLVTVRATELLAADQDPPALSSVLHITVTVGDEEEAGKITLDRLQPEAGATLTATLSDPDRGEGNDQDPQGLTWTWSIPKVSRPDIENNNHWQTAGGSATPTAQQSAYLANASDVTSILRVKVEYTDQEGSDKEVNKLSYYAVRAAPAEGTNADPQFDDTADFTSNVPEDTAVGTAVGNPIIASDTNDGDILSYVLSGTGDDADSFDIDIATGQITVADELDHEAGSDGNDGVYELVVTAYDPSNANDATATDRGATATGHVTITATDVNEKPRVTTDDADPAEMLKVDEEHRVVLPDPPDGVTRVVIGAYGAEDDDIGDGGGDPVTADASKVKLSLGGDDADAFELEDADADNADNRTLRFKNSPNFEMPDDANQDNVYKVSIVATDDKGLIGMKDLTVEVMNIDEVGTVSLSRIQPGVGQPITASLSDPDGGVNDMKWQWARALTEAGTYVEIDGATSATYTPKAPTEDNPDTIGINEKDAGDEGYFLRARVTYRDAQSTDDIDTTDHEEGRRGEDDPTTLTGDPQAVGEAPVEKVSQNAVRAVPGVNRAPVFDSATMTRKVNENETVNVGDPVTADDPDDDALSYSISGGADMGSFDIVLGTGQITVADGTELDAEGQTSYEVEVTADDPFGGSDSTMVTIMVLNLNEEPEFKAEDPDDYEENGMGAVATFMATDPEGADIDWSVEGLDAADFEIDGGVLTFKKAPNYEGPTDRERIEVVALPDADPPVLGVEAEDDDNNVYLVTVRASEVRAADAEGATMSTIQDIAVTVTNVEEPGTIGLSHVQPQTGVGITASLTDPDGDDDGEREIDADDITWLWSVPKVSRPVINDNDHWTPAAATNNTITYSPENGDETEVLRVRATYTDGEGAMKTAYKLSYNAVRPQPSANNAPTFPPSANYNRGIAEDAAVDAPVGTPVTASDVNSGDAGKLTYSLTADGVNANLFKIDKMTGQIRVAMPLNHETEGLVDGGYSVTVNVIDPSNNDVNGPPFDTGQPVTRDVAITAADVNEKPTVVLAVVNGQTSTEMMKVDENHPVVDVEADQDATPPIDAEDAIVIATYDAEDEDVNDGSIVGGTLTANASEVKLSLGGEDADDFVLGDPDATTGARELTFKNSPDFESPTDANQDNAYKVTIIATDKKGLQGTRDVTVSVNNLDEVGKVTLSTIQPGIGQPVTAMLTDPDGGVSGARWQWHSANVEAGPYAPIHQATSATYTPKETVPDNPATDINEAVTGDEGLYLRVTVTYRDAQSVDDNEGTANVEEGRRGIDDTNTADVDERVKATSENAVRAVPDMNFAPVFASGITREVKETADPGDNVGDAVTADDPENDPLDYSITGGADMGAFDIDEETGQITVGDGTMLDYEGSQRIYVVEVTADDPFDGSDSTMVTIMVTNVNEPPELNLVAPVTPPDTTDPTPEPENNAPAFADDATTREVAENTAAGTNVGAPVTATDADNDTLTYTLGGADMASFTIDANGQIMTSAALDYETKASYAVTVTAMDDEDSDSITVTISVTNVGLDNKYDTDDSGSISKGEVLGAISAYFRNPSPAAKQDVLELIALYFTGLRSAN